MPKKFRVYVISFLALAALLVSAFSAGAFSKGQNHSNASTQFATSAKPATARVASMHTINMQNVATTSPKAFNPHAKTLPLLHQVNKSTAASSKNVPHFNGLSNTSLNNGPFTPSALARFHGMADSPTVCPPSGCQPPDMAVAASPLWVFQGVNTAYAVYNTSGHIQPGWPKNAQDFFGIPNLPHNCDPAGPFLSDPRA